MLSRHADTPPLCRHFAADFHFRRLTLFVFRRRLMRRCRFFAIRR